MKIYVCGQLINQEIVSINSKGYDETDIQLLDINTFSQDKKTRLVGLGKNKIYKLTLKSWKELKKELNKSGLIYKVAAQATLYTPCYCGQCLRVRLS